MVKSTTIVTVIPTLPLDTNSRACWITTKYNCQCIQHNTACMCCTNKCWFNFTHTLPLTLALFLPGTQLHYPDRFVGKRGQGPHRKPTPFSVHSSQNIAMPKVQVLFCLQHSAQVLGQATQHQHGTEHAHDSASTPTGFYKCS